MAVILNWRNLPAVKLGVSSVQRSLHSGINRRALLLRETNVPLPNVNCLQSRSFKSQLKIKWVRPPKIPCIDPVKSGDLQPAVPVDLNRLPPAFEKAIGCEELNDLVRRVLSLNFNHGNIAAKLARDEMVNSVKMHNLDTSSEEAKIAQMTARIRNLQQHMEKFSRDKKTKVVLKELIEKRKKHLKFLRAKDYRRFEWLLEKLQIEYRPPPDEYIKVTRKDSLRKLTRRHCLLVRQQHLDELRQNFEEQKPIFLREKLEKLKWILQQELKYKIEPTVTEEDIQKVENQLKELENGKVGKQDKNANVA